MVVFKIVNSYSFLSPTLSLFHNICSLCLIKTLLISPFLSLSLSFVLVAKLAGRDLSAMNAKPIPVVFMAHAPSLGNAFVMKVGVVYFAIKI